MAHPQDKYGTRICKDLELRYIATRTKTDHQLSPRGTVTALAVGEWIGRQVICARAPDAIYCTLRGVEIVGRHGALQSVVEQPLDVRGGFFREVDAEWTVAASLT